MYFNKKYNQSGHVFQGKYKAKIIEDDNSLTRVSTYIHQNPWELQLTNNYSWSSLQDYQENRWGTLLQSSLVIDRFESFRDYVNEVERTHQNKLLIKELQP